jgi:hypothetical protein
MRTSVVTSARMVGWGHHPSRRGPQPLARDFTRAQPVQVFCCAVGYGLDISASTTESMSKGAPPLRRMDMADIDPIEVSNLDIYGNAPLEWSRAREQLGRWHGPDVSHFLCTTRPDGQPHVAGVGAIWLDGDLYIVSGDGTRKSKNLAIHPACSIAVRLPGIDVTLEGTAAHVTDAQTLDRVAALYRQLGWPADVDATARASNPLRLPGSVSFSGFFDSARSLRSISSPLRRWQCPAPSFRR